MLVLLESVNMYITYIGNWIVHLCLCKFIGLYITVGDILIEALMGSQLQCVAGSLPDENTKLP